ncbi:helix-turn-helix domain-containing protein [Mollicutes bacterium LVI A0039]|nr:helix-turn-helix domain-containing protein [Mollicutes bacterium LVI A0039]
MILQKLLHINPTYLSTLFKAEVGTTIVKYTNTLRLEAAISDIQHTNLSITTIAHNHGFADVRTLNELTKSRYQVTPMQIRQKVTSHKVNTTQNNFNNIIDKYRLDLNFNTITEQNVEIAGNHQTNTYKNSFNTIAIGRAHDILYAQVQEQLIASKQELNFTYCRFHNIFGDEMNIVDIDFFERFKFNFQKPFAVIEFLLANNIIPFIEIGFFPKEIAQGFPSVFSGYNINVGGTIDFQLWEQLIHEFFTSLKALFPDDCFDMRFDFWNEIDIQGFWPNSKDDLFKLYEISYQTIKKIDARFLVGGFNYGNFISDTQAIEQDLDYLQQHGLLPDFLTIHSYPFYIDGEISHNPDFAATQIKIKYIKGKLNDDISKLVALQKKYNFAETYITEWNTSPLQREHLNDGLYKSSKIISEVINSHSLHVDGICYWTLSDEMAEFGYPVGEVHGGFGLITRNGIPKPAFYSFVAASTLQGNILFKNNNCIIVQNEDSIYMLLNNDVDYDRNYYTQNFGTAPQTMEGNDLKVNISLTNLTNSIYQEVIYQIDEHCDLYANFKHLYNDKHYLQNKEVEHLKQLSKPHIHSRILALDEHYTTVINLKPTHTTMIVLKKIKQRTKRKPI